jgi:glutamate racemase
MQWKIILQTERVLHMDSRPIGLLDSGLGGLSVVKKVIQAMPWESTVFIGDQANMPYGDRSKQGIIALTRKSMAYLLSQDVKVIIFACNTATAMAMPTLQKETDRQIIGVIQSGALMAAKTTRTKQVATISTKATALAHSYRADIQARDPEIQVTELATPLLAPLVEKEPGQKEVDRVVRESLQPLQGKHFDTLVLGCTHYPLIQDSIAACVPQGTNIVDPADQVALYTYNVLRRDGLLADWRGDATHKYVTTGDPVRFGQIAAKWLNDPNLQAVHQDA